MDAKRVHETFARRLTKLRRDQRLSQEILADRLGISRSTVGMYEQGHREPDLKSLGLIANYFGVSFDYLLDPDEEEQF